MRWHLKHEQHGDKPWPVQAEALKRADGRDRYGHFLEQGLGKTAVNLNEFVDADGVDLNIVLAPASFMADWPLAPAEWGLGFLRTGMWGHDDLPFDWDSGVYSIAHETLRGSRNTRRALIKLFQDRRCLLTFDESTGIKNPSSLLAKYVVGELVKEARMVRLLNGTPMVQNVEDWYPQLRSLGALNGMERLSFRNRFAKMGGFMGKKVVGPNEDRQEELASIINGVGFRALKRDWRPGMPDQLTVPIHLEMTDKQRGHYRTMMEDFSAMVGSEEITAELVLTQRMKCQQISSCMLMKDDRAHWFEQPEDNPKLKAALTLMETGHGKMIVTYYFDPSGRMLIEQFRKAGLNPAFIVGKMSGPEIVEQKAKFNNDGSCRILVGQIDQTSRGHTLLGQKGKDRCYRIFFYETSLSLMHRLQMNDRNHRGDQDETCYLYDPICCPIDQLNVDILTGKRQQADAMDALIKLVREKRY